MRAALGRVAARSVRCSNRAPRGIKVAIAERAGTRIRWPIWLSGLALFYTSVALVLATQDYLLAPKRGLFVPWLGWVGYRFTQWFVWTGWTANRDSATASSTWLP